MTPITFESFTERLLSLYALPQRSPRTRRKMVHLLGLLCELGVTSTDQLTTELAARFVASRAELVGPNTIRGDLGYFAAACSFAVEEDWLDRVPRLRRIRPRPGPAARERLHSIADIGRVLEMLASRRADWVGGRLYCLASVVAMTGGRRDEVLYMQVEDVDLSRGVINIDPRRRLKTWASAAPVPIPADLRPILSEWIPRTESLWLIPNRIKRSTPWTGGRLGKRPVDALRSAGNECGVIGLTFQSLRHSFATHCRRRFGLSALELATVLRHTTESTQKHYIWPDHQCLVDSVKHVSYRAS